MRIGGARSSSAFLGAREPVDKTDAGAFPAPRTVAVSTSFSVVDSVGPAGYHSRCGRRCPRWNCWCRAAPAWTWPKTRWSPVCGCLTARAAAARRSAPTRPSPRGWRRGPGGGGGGAERRGRPRGGDGGHRPYWKPVWWVLEERGFQLLLVNARHVKILPGRKTG